MKRLLALLTLFVILALAVLSACGGGNGDATQDQPLESTDTSADTSTDNSQPNEEANLMYKGDVYLDYASRMTAQIDLHHQEADFSADLPYTLKVLNEGNWMEAIKEFSLDEFLYKITVGEDTVYFQDLTNFFFDPKRNMVVYARQAHLNIQASDIKDELSDAVYEYPRVNYPAVGKYTSPYRMEGTNFSYNATGYELVTEIDADISARTIEAHTNSKIIAVYDGRYTYFFNYLTGELLTSEEGKYLCPGCFDGFMHGNPEDYSLEKLYNSESDCVWFDYRSLERGENDDPSHHHEPGAVWAHSYSQNKTTAYTVYGESRNAYGGYDALPQGSCYACQYVEFKDNIKGPIDEMGDVIKLDTLGKFGLVYGGKTLVPFEYDKIETYQTRFMHTDEERLGVYRAIKNGVTYYFSTDGTNLTPNGFASGSQPRDNRAIVYDGEKLYLIKFTTKERLNHTMLVPLYARGEGEILLANDERKEIYDIIVGNGWEALPTDCYFDYIFFLGEENYCYYASECGTFLKDENHKTVTEEQRKRINQLLAFEDTAPAPAPEEAYNKYVYTFTYHGSYFSLEQYKIINGENNKRIQQFLMDADWQNGEKSGEDYDYAFDIGLTDQARVYYKENGLLYDKTYRRYAKLDDNKAAELTAILRNPDYIPTGKTKTEEFTVAYHGAKDLAVNKDRFYATDKNGVLYRLFYHDTSKLTEGCVVSVTYEDKFMLEEVSNHYGYVYYAADFKPEQGISVLNIQVLSSPATDNLEPVREVEYVENGFVVDAEFGDGSPLDSIADMPGQNVAYTVFQSEADVEAYRNSTLNKFQSLVNQFYTPVIQKMDKRFFGENAVVVVLAQSDNYFTCFNITGIKVNNGVMTIGVTARENDGIRIEKEQQNLFFLEISKYQLADCKEIKVDMTVVPAESNNYDDAPTEFEYRFNHIAMWDSEFKIKELPYFSIVSKEQLDFVCNLTNFRPSVRYGDYKKHEFVNFTEEFFEENALICFPVTLYEPIPYKDYVNAELVDGTLTITISYTKNTPVNEYETWHYLVIDKDIIPTIKSCEIVHKTNE